MEKNISFFTSTQKSKSMNNKEQFFDSTVMNNGFKMTYCFKSLSWVKVLFTVLGQDTY